MTGTKVQIVSPPASVLEAHLTETEKFDGTDTRKYSMTLAFSEDQVQPIREAILEAGGGKGMSPLKERDGLFLLKARSTYPVRVVDVANEPIALERITVGAEVRAKLGFASYKSQGGGVTTYLGNIQLLRSVYDAQVTLGDLLDDYDESDLPF